MRVLLLTQFYPPIAGGQERHVRSLAQELAKRAHHVEVATIAAAGTGDVGTTFDGEVAVHRLRATTQRLAGLHVEAERPHVAPAVDPELRMGIHRLLSAGAFDVLHAHDWAVDSAIGPARATGTPVVMTQHDYGQVCATKRMMRAGVVCPGPEVVACLRCASTYYGPIVGPGVALADLVSSRRRRARVASFIPVSSTIATRTGVRDRDYEVIPNFVPDDLVLSGPAPPSDGTLLIAGDLALDKGVGTLLDAYRLLRQPPRLVLAGRVFPETPRDLPPGCELVGLLLHDELLATMRRSLAVVVPSIVLDPSPTVVLEAMALGRPVIGARSGGIVDMVEDGVSGLLVPPGDTPALAAALSALIDDPEYAARLGLGALKRVRNYTASGVVGRIEARYRHVVEGYGRAG
jgi:glycosyltransferase involved in cell wall biosynthesis